MPRKKSSTKPLFIAEKLSLFYGDGNWTIRGVKRAGIAPTRIAQGPCGLRRNKDDGLSLNNVEPATAYPSPALIACSFDSDLIQRYGVSLGKECKAHGVDALIGPGINIKRNPLCGRSFEYYSEDPYVSGKLAASFIKGIQSVGVAACVNHFACNSQETFRMVNDSIVDERTLREIYLRGFELAIKEANPWMVMAAYNKVNGTFCSENSYLLKDILKGEWKYDGVVISDWGAVSDPVLCHINGLDVEMPCYGNRKNALMFAARKGRLTLPAIDDVAKRVTLLSSRTHKPSAKAVSFSPEEAHKLAVEMAEKSCVLAKNDGVLPLKKLKNIAVIGELAAHPRYGGNGSSLVSPLSPKSFLQRAKELVRDPSDIIYAQGYVLNGAEDNSVTLNAIDVASRCETVLLFLGTELEQDCEGVDRVRLTLPPEQISLLEHIREVNENIIVVLSTGSPVELPFIDKIKGLLVTYFMGEGSGEALCRLLLGEVNPSGHFAETWPLRNYEVPSFGFYPGDETQSLYREAIYVGYRYYLTAEEKTRFPFGYGLSYSTFRYGGLKLSSKKMNVDETITVTVNVKNVSSVPGEALVQLYVEPRSQFVFKAKRTLQGFKKVALGAHESKDVTLTLDRTAFEHYDVNGKKFSVESDEYLIQIGASCEEILLSASLDVIGDISSNSTVSQYPVYYRPPRDGFWQYDSAFEELLGRVVSLGHDPNSPPYNLNSTIHDIRSTFIGKKLIAKIERRSAGKPDAGVIMRIALEMPIRNLAMGGIKEKYIRWIVDMANGHFLRAIFRAILGF